MRFPLDLYFLGGEGEVVAVRRGVPARRLAFCGGAMRRAGAAGGEGGEIPPASLLDRPMLPQRREIANLVVCEDDAQTLELLCDNLVADRFGVLPAPNASDALRLCRYNHPDLLLLDLSLPDASGLDVLREIRERRRGHLALRSEPCR